MRLASLAAEVVAELKMPNLASSTYIGRVVAADRDVFIMDVGRRSGIVLNKAELDRSPKLGEEVQVRFREGRGTVEGLARARQMTLEL